MKTILHEIKSGMVIFKDSFSRLLFANKQAHSILASQEAPVIRVEEKT